MTFVTDQMNAAATFAYTMIVVDDEPTENPVVEVVPDTVENPRRANSRMVAKEIDSKAPDAPEVKLSHLLNAKELVKSALNLGLVCSVVNPDGNEEEVANSIAKAAKRADIVSLDWHMNAGDEGELASQIVTRILLDDEDSGGRLRLIAIYTGNKDRERIFRQLIERINSHDEIKNKVESIDNAVVNSSGLRLVWREKAMGSEEIGKVKEEDLPKELLVEFSKLSSGLLSNVALATIATLRDTTHHVLGKFKSNLDGPFFHHLAFQENPSSSMDYAVSIILSAIKSEVNKSNIVDNYISNSAIRNRVEHAHNKLGGYDLKFSAGANEKKFNLNVDDVSTIINRGFVNWPAQERDAAVARQAEGRDRNFPGNKVFEKHFSSTFSESLASAKQDMFNFSFLTNSQSSELSKAHLKSAPRLSLGSVLYNIKKKEYLLCLQATCDSVRGDGMFFFIPLVTTTEKPDVTVPHGKENISKKVLSNSPRFVSLKIPNKCYTQSRSINFGKIDVNKGYIAINHNPKNGSYYVKDSSDITYRWLANLKYKRALRIAQNVSQEISRIGFDEFGPFRN